MVLSNKKTPHFCGGLNLRYQKQHQQSSLKNIETQQKSTSVQRVSNRDHTSSAVKITFRGIAALNYLMLIIFAICVPDFNEEKLFVNK